MNIDERRQMAREKNLCFNCLSKGHSGAACSSRFRCHICQSKHHTLLHASNTTQQSQSQTNNTNLQSNTHHVHTEQFAPNTTVQTPTSQVTDSHSYNSSLQRDMPIHTQSVKIVLLPTILVSVRDEVGIMQPCRALLDTGSQSSFITDECVQRLGLSRSNARIAITGLAEKGVGITRGLVHLSLHSRYNSQLFITINALVLTKLTKMLPSQTVQCNVREFTNLPLADPTFQTPGKVDILIGAESVFHILKPEHIVSSSSGLIAQNTIFGWVISGGVQENIQSTTSLSSQLSLQSIDSTLRRFWEIDDFKTDECFWSEEEKMCEKHFMETHKRDETGRYVVELPFKLNTSQLGNSLPQACKRQISIERRLSIDNNLRYEYDNFMNEYEKLGHMHVLPTNEISIDPEKSYYLPHHPVIKADSITTKVRVVFDASSKTTTGTSLNDMLLIGPTVQNSLIAIILRFRRHRIVFSADVEKMYRQIKIADHHQDFQRIVWRKTANERLQHYRLSTVTYGTAAAPFLATRVLRQIAEINKHQYKSAAEVIQDDVYVDDLMSGADSEANALELQRDIVAILSSCGFNLRKWASNDKRLLAHIREEHKSEQAVIEFDNDEQTIKVLGLQWCPTSDSFSFKVSINDNSVFTKRGLLSEAARLFDPLGWLAPVIIKIKILFQQLWIIKLDWDELLPASTIEEWVHIKSELKSLEQIHIPRWLICSSTNTIDTQIHGFCDSSQDAYAAVLYCRVVDNNGIVSINLVTSKTKVAPIKQISIPRLELCAAHLLKNLLKFVDSTLKLHSSRIVLWTDSTIVLSWLSAIPRTLKTFVANRVANIQSMKLDVQWKHISSAENPADCASRGINPNSLVDHTLWWNGPKWLSLKEEHWPTQKYVIKNDSAEVKTQKLVVHNSSTTPDNIFDIIIERHSSWSKMIRVLAFLQKFCHILICKRSNQSTSSFGHFITVKNIHTAEIQLVKHVQMSTFSEDIHSLQNKRIINRKSNLLMLNPFIDNEGVLRVGGRIQKAHAQYSAIHPIIFPSKHQVTERLIQFYHIKHLHAGISTMVAIIRQKYWIINCKQIVKSIIRKCPTCIRYNSAPLKQIMGSLPSARVQITSPFVKTAVDYAGPFILKTHRVRKAKTYKAWISLFVCQSTKALHLELVTDMTTEGFLACFKRFTGRRGICEEVYSDNGTNFIGARRELNELHKLLLKTANNNLISESLAMDGTKWSLMPPSSPHFGGLHEAGVKSIKAHLKKVLGISIVTYEEMSTLLVQIEAILNSRPICRTDDAEIDALTPAHFLIGRPITLIPEPDLQEVHLSRLSRWQYFQRLTQQFWKRWSLEYLNTLQRRAKWGVQTKNVQVNDIIILKEDNLPPAKWVLAKIIKLHPGDDGNVRIVTLKTKTGISKRPITKIIPIPLS